MALEPNAIHASNLALTLFELERFPEAEAATRRALEFEPNSSELKIRLAWTMAQQGRCEEAIEALRNVASCEPDNPFAMSTLSGVLLLTGRVNAAVDVAADLVRKHPDIASAPETLAYAYFKQGNPAASLRHYERAIALAPGNIELHAGRGGALALAGRHTEAIGEFEFVQRAIPDYLDRYPEFADCLAASRSALGK